jgi:regulator of replication initiation timing
MPNGGGGFHNYDDRRPWERVRDMEQELDKLRKENRELVEERTALETERDVLLRRLGKQALEKGK